MNNTQGKNGNHFSLEPLVHEAGAKGGLHISADTKRVGLVIVLAVASFLTVFFLSGGSADNTKTQLRFADDGSATPAPTGTPAPTVTPVGVASPVATSPGSLAYNGFPDFAANGNQNGIASTVIRNSAATNGNANASTMGYNSNSNTANSNTANSNTANSNAAYPTSGSVPLRSASPTPIVTAPTPTPTPPAVLGQYGVIGTAGEYMAPTPYPSPSPTPTPTPTPTPSPSPSPSASAEPIKRGMQQSGPAAWMALLPVLMVGVFRFARKG